MRREAARYLGRDRLTVGRVECECTFSTSTGFPGLQTHSEKPSYRANSLTRAYETSRSQAVCRLGTVQGRPAGPGDS